MPSACIKSRQRFGALALLCLAWPIFAAAQGLVYAHREGGRCAVRARTTMFPNAAHGTAALNALCRYRPQTDQWVPIALPTEKTRALQPNPNPPAARS